MVEGGSEETELLIQARMPTQAAEIDGRVLINDLGDLGESPTAELRPGDLAEVEVTEVLDSDLVARLVRVTRPALIATPGLKTSIGKGLEMRSGSAAH
jgi:ribosomal protein S12 methylthiotransferase